MNSRLRLCAPLALVLVLSFSACGDDENPADGGTADTTPPGVSSVTATDQNHIEVVFSEAVTRVDAEDESNYVILLEVPAPVAPRDAKAAAGGGLPIDVATLGTDSRTATLTTAAMISGDYSMSIQNIRDRHGNPIITPVVKSFPGSTVADDTPPSLVLRSPGPDATNVSATAILEIGFSEPILTSDLQAEFGMSSTSGVVNVIFSSDDDALFTGTHDPLDLDDIHTITLSGVQDLAGNVMADTEWTFRTTSNADHTPPTLVSSVPSNLAVNVDVNSTLSLTFSEAIDPNSFEPLFTPDISGSYTWSGDKKTLTFEPSVALFDDTQYELEIFPGDVADLAGNFNTALFTRVFTTGAALESGSIAGTISGDPNSDFASDPTGAFVAAADAFPFGGGGFNVYGATTVAGNNSYQLKYLLDGTYFPLCIKDTADDGLLEPFLGDALGLYGIDIAVGDMTPLDVTLAGGSDATGINFPLYDPTSVHGAVYYKGMYSGESHDIVVGLFSTAGFDPVTSVPVAAGDAFWPTNPFFVINSIEAGPIPDGNYYLGAFLDANDNGDYDAAIDPAGLYGGTPPTAINLADGSDAPDKNFLLDDPAPGASIGATHWVVKPHVAWLRNLAKAVREAQLTQK